MGGVCQELAVRFTCPLQSYSSCPLRYSRFNCSRLLADAILVLLTRSDVRFVPTDSGGLTLLTYR